MLKTFANDGGPDLARAARKGWVAAIIHNPFAGRYEPELQWFMDELKPLGLECSTRLCAAMGIQPAEVEAYGKGSIVGVNGEVEHGALWHVPGGYAMRELIGQALAIVPSAAKVAAMGTAIDLPIHHKDAAYVRSHFDAITCAVPDAPRPDEILFALCMSTGGRPHARMGGLEAAGITKWTGNADTTICHARSCSGCRHVWVRIPEQGDILATNARMTAPNQVNLTGRLPSGGRGIPH